MIVRDDSSIKLSEEARMEGGGKAGLIIKPGNIPDKEKRGTPRREKSAS